MSRTHDITISGFDLDRLEAELNEMTLRWERTNDALLAERALADRLAKCLSYHAEVDGEYAPDTTLAALAAWKEARSE